MKTLTIKVPDELYADISKASEIRRVPKSEVVRERLQGKFKLYADCLIVGSL